MALLIMCCYDTEENKRTEYTVKTLESIFNTVDLIKNRVIIVDNNSCQATKDVLNAIEDTRIEVITMSENVGTAQGVNQGIYKRRPNEAVIKMDNDVVIHSKNWIEEMKHVLHKMPEVGIVGLKRKDIAQSPTAKDAWFKTSLEFLPHEPGEPWITVEKSDDIIGTCTMINPRLLDKVGFYRQIGVYGFDDAILAKLSLLNGFKNYFLPHINIDHIDRGDTPYHQEKNKLAAADWEPFKALLKGYIDKTIPMYYDGGFKS